MYILSIWKKSLLLTGWLWWTTLFSLFIIIVHCCHEVTIQIINITLLIHQEFLVFVIWIFWFETLDLYSFEALRLQLHRIVDIYAQVCILKILAVQAHIWIKTISAWGSVWHSEIIAHGLWGLIGIIILLAWWCCIRLPELLRFWCLLYHVLICAFLSRVWWCFLHLAQNVVQHVFWHGWSLALRLLYKLWIWQIVFIFTFFCWAQITDVVQSWWQICF